LLQLGDDRDTTSLLVHDGMDEFDIRRGAHEGQGDEVNAEVQGETEILDVLLGQGGNGDVHARQGVTLVDGDGATFGDLADDVIALNGDADEADLAVIDQQAVSRAGIVGQVLVGGGHAVMGAFDVLHRDADRLTGLPYGCAVLEPSETDLGALQVGEDADRTTGLVSGFTDPLVVLFMVGVITVREVQAGDIHAVLNQSEDPIRAGDRRTEGAYNFSSSFHIDQPNPSRLRRRQWLRESNSLFT